MTTFDFSICVACSLHTYFRTYAEVRVVASTLNETGPLLSSTPTDTRTYAFKLCAATMYCVQQEEPIQGDTNDSAAAVVFNANRHAHT